MRVLALGVFYGGVFLALAIIHFRFTSVAEEGACAQAALFTEASEGRVDAHCEAGLLIDATSGVPPHDVVERGPNRMRPHQQRFFITRVNSCV